MPAMSKEKYPTFLPGSSTYCPEAPPECSLTANTPVIDFEQRGLLDRSEAADAPEDGRLPA